MLSSFDPPYNSIEREKITSGIYKYFVVNEDGERIKEIDDKYYNSICIGEYSRFEEIDVLDTKIEFDSNRIKNEIEDLRKSIDIASEFESLEKFVKKRIDPDFIPAEPELKSNLLNKVRELEELLKDISPYQSEMRKANTSFYFHKFTYREILPSYEVASHLTEGMSGNYWKEISIDEIDDYDDVMVDKMDSKEILLKAIIDDSGNLLIDNVKGVAKFIPECCLFILELSRHRGSKWFEKYSPESSEYLLRPHKLMAVINQYGDFVITPKWISKEKTIKYELIDKSPEEFDIIFEIDSEYFNSSGNKIDISK